MELHAGIIRVSSEARLLKVSGSVVRPLQANTQGMV